MIYRQANEVVRVAILEQRCFVAILAKYMRAPSNIQINEGLLRFATR